MREMWETFFLEEEIHQTPSALPWTRSVVYARNVFSREGISSDIISYNMREMWETFFLEEEIHQTPSALPWDRMLLKVILTYPWTVISSKSDQNNYACKRREVEVNPGGHLTKHQYLTLSEASRSPWPETKLSSVLFKEIYKASCLLPYF